jgi:hypothetical protein
MAMSNVVPALTGCADEFANLFIVFAMLGADEDKFKIVSD